MFKCTYIKYTWGTRTYTYNRGAIAANTPDVPREHHVRGAYRAAQKQLRHRSIGGGSSENLITNLDNAKYYTIVIVEAWKWYNVCTYFMEILRINFH